MQQGGRLESQDDVPEEVREQLYAEEQQAEERQRKRRARSPANYPPINITNVLPAQSPQAPQASTALYPTGPQPAFVESVAAKGSSLEIPEPLGISVQRYTAWQKSRYSAEEVKMEYQKAGDLTLAEGLDLELVYEDQDAELYIKKGVKSGVARRFVRDIATWAKMCRVQPQ